MSGRRCSNSRDDAVEFGVGVGQSGEIALIDNRGSEPRLGEDHDAGRRLQEMRASAGADDEKESVLDFTVQPDDAGKAAEHFALPALPQNGCWPPPHRSCARAWHARSWREPHAPDAAR